MKKRLKKMLIPMLASRQIASIAHRLFNYGTPVFMLHRITPHGQPAEGKTDPDHLRNCLQYLHKNHHTCISLEQLISSLHDNKPLPAKTVCFTMDDGYIDQAQIAAPVFLEYNCPVTLFVITDMLDHIAWPWDAKVSWIIETSQQSSLESSAVIKQLGINNGKIANKRKLRRSIQNAIKTLDVKVIPDILQQLADSAGVTIPDTPPPDYQPMSWNDARQLEKQGVCFAPHSVSHNIMSRLDQESMEWEINQAWQLICNELKNPLKVFCYPTGRPADFGRREIEALKKSGYLGAVSVTPEFVKNNKQSHNYIFSLPRLALPGNMTDFIQCCSWVEGIRATRSNR